MRVPKREREREGERERERKKERERGGDEVSVGERANQNRPFYSVNFFTVQYSKIVGY